MSATNTSTIVVNYCSDPAWAPYESIENGSHIGFAKEYLDLIERYSQLTFNLVPTTDWHQALAFVKQGKCQMLPMLNQSPEREKFLKFSDVYFRAPNTIYAHYNQPMIGNLASIDTQTVAVVSGYRMHNYVKNNFPNMQLIAVENEQEGLNKVDNQTVDYFVGSFFAANKLIKENALTNLRIVGIAELEDHLRVGVNYQSTFLLPHINKAIEQITPQNHSNVFSYLNKMNLVTHTDYSIAIKSGIAFFFTIFVLTIFYLRSIKHANTLTDKNIALEKLHVQLDEKNKQLEELAIRDPLTNLYNRSHLSEVINQQIKLKGRYSTSACLLMIDIDDFKQFNDLYGHKTGDDVLQQVSYVLIQCARESDIAARWGGEEFILLCPQTSIDDANLLAQRFQQELTTLKTERFPAVTCSIGIAELASDNNADEWFTAADSAMYQAKSQGKDSIFTLKT